MFVHHQPSVTDIRHAAILDFCFFRLRASDIMEPNLTYVYPHTRIQSLVSILRTTVHHAFPVVTENRGNEREFMKGNQLISNNIKFKVKSCLLDELKSRELCFAYKWPCFSYLGFWAEFRSDISTYCNTKLRTPFHSVQSGLHS